MNYKYIDQLLERYWNCETSIQEEQILRAFFQQEEIPTYLQPYRQIFKAEEELANAHLSQDFDDRIMAMIEEETENTTVKARRISFPRRISPFYKAAGMIAVILVIGMAAQHSFQSAEQDESLQFVQQNEEDSSLEFSLTPNAAIQTSSLPIPTSTDTIDQVLQEQTDKMPN